MFFRVFRFPKASFNALTSLFLNFKTSTTSWQWDVRNIAMTILQFDLWNHKLKLKFRATFCSLPGKSEIRETWSVLLILRRQCYRLGRRVYDIERINELVQSWGDGAIWGPRDDVSIFTWPFLCLNCSSQSRYRRYNELGCVIYWYYLSFFLFSGYLLTG